MFSLLLCERESGLFFVCGLLMSSGKKKKTEDKKEKKKRFLLQEEGNLSLSEGALWPIKSCFPLFFSLFLSFSFFCGLINTRSFFDPLRARHHHLREKKRAHTQQQQQQQQQSTTTQTKDRKKCERSSSAEFKNQFV